MKALNQNKRQQRIDWLTYGGIACLVFIILMIFAGKKSFFSDEMDQLGILASVRTLPELLRLYARVGHEVAPPLFAFLAWCWYQVVPHTQVWLQALPALLTCAGVYVMGLAGRAYGGRRMGVLAALLALNAPAITLTAGLQLRQYGALFLISALTTYLYVLRNRGNGEKWSNIVLYGVAMAGLPYTHYVSALLPVAFFLIDLVLVIKKRIRIKQLVSYAIGAGLFLPWALAVFRSVSARTEFWLDKPRISDLVNTLHFLTDGEGMGALLCLFLAGCSILLAKTVMRDEDPDWAHERGIVDLGLAGAPFFMMGCVFVYSAYFSDGISLFLPRYFISAIPVILLTAAYGLHTVFSGLLCRNVQPERRLRTAFLALCLFVGAVSVLHMEQTVRTDTSTVYEPYREAADWLMEQPDIHGDDVAVLTSNLSRYVTKGWETLYVTRNGQREPFRVFDYANPFTEADVGTYDVVYVFIEHAALPAEAQALLKAYYQQDAGCMDGVQWRVTRYLRQGAPE